METHFTADPNDKHSTQKNIIIFVILTAVLFGLDIGILISYAGLQLGLYPIPAFGVIGGSIGGFVAGLVQVFSQADSKIVKKFLYFILFINAIIFLFFLSEAFPIAGAIMFLIIIMIPGIVNAYIFFFITKKLSTYLTNSPIDWPFFLFQLTIGLIIGLVSIVFFSLFGAMFMAI